MKTYVSSLALGILVGVIYGLFNVRSPAPPIVALIGLLGILLGEQLPPLVRHALNVDAVVGSWLQDQVMPHIFGQLPQCKGAQALTAAAQAAESAVGDSHHG